MARHQPLRMRARLAQHMAEEPLPPPAPVSFAREPAVPEPTDASAVAFPKFPWGKTLEPGPLDSVTPEPDPHQPPECDPFDVQDLDISSLMADGLDSNRLGDEPSILSDWKDTAPDQPVAAETGDAVRAAATGCGLEGAGHSSPNPRAAEPGRDHWSRRAVCAAAFVTISVIGLLTWISTRPEEYGWPASWKLQTKSQEEPLPYITSVPLVPSPSRSGAEDNQSGVPDRVVLKTDEDEAEPDRDAVELR